MNSTLFSFFESQPDVSTEDGVSTPLFDEVLTHQSQNLTTTYEFFNIEPPAKRFKPKPLRSWVCTCEHGQHKHDHAVGGCTECGCPLFQYKENSK